VTSVAYADVYFAYVMNVLFSSPTGNCMLKRIIGKERRNSDMFSVRRMLNE